MAKKDTIKTVINRGAIVAKQTKKAPEQGANSVSKNIQSAKGNTSNAFNTKKNQEDAKNYQLKGTVQRYQDTSPEALMKRSNENVGRRLEKVQAKAEKRNEAGRNQTKARRGTQKPQVSNMPQYAVSKTEAPEFTNLPKYIDSKTVPESFDASKATQNKSIPSLNDYDNNLLDALSAGYTSFNERLSGAKTLAKATQALTGSKEVADSMLDTWRQVKAGLDYDSMPMMGGPVNQDVNKLYEEHPTAEKVGDYAGKMAQFSIMSQLLPLIPGVGAAQAGLASKLGGGALGNYLANTTFDIIPDLALDVAPNAINNVASGMSGKDVAKNAAKDVAINEILNLAGNALPFLGDFLGNKLIKNKVAKDVAKNVDEVIPEDMLAKRIAEEQATKEPVQNVVKQLEELQQPKTVAESVADSTLTGKIPEEPIVPKDTSIPKEDYSGLRQEPSKYYDNTLKKTTDEETYERLYKDLKNEDTHAVKGNDWKQQVAERRLAEDGADAWYDRLVNAEELASEDLRTAYLLKSQLEATDPVKAAQLQRSLRPHITNSGQLLNELAQQAKTVPEAQLEYGLAQARKVVDESRKQPGFSDAVNKMADKVQSAIEKGNLEEAKKLVTQKLSDFATGEKAKGVLKNTSADGQQMVLDLIGGYSPDKMSTKELAEEAASLMRKQNGVADFSAKDELEILNLLKMQSEFEKGSMQYKEYQALAAAYIDKKIPTSASEKVKTILYDNMLGNIRTMLTRNAGGNFFANTLEKAQKPLKVGIDKATSKVTGTRNYILSTDVAKAYNDGFKKGLADQWHDLKTGINTTRSGEEGLEDALANVHRVFKGDGNLSKALNEYDRLVKGTMGMGDRPFYEAEYAAAKKELQLISEKFGPDALQRVGVPPTELGNTDAIIEFWARQRALDACFQNGSLTSNALSKFKEASGLLGEEIGGKTIGNALKQSAMPFTQVAGNMFSRFTDYIPVVGSVKNIANTAAETLGKGPGLNQKRFVDATSRNLVGMGLGGLGVGMAHNVANGGRLGITGSYSDDADEKAAQIAAGFQPYSVQIPIGDKDYQFNIDDIPVLGPMAEASSNAYEAYQQNKDDPLGAAMSGLKGGVSSATSNSMLQGLNRMFGTNQYNGSESFGDRMLDVLYSLPGQAIPSPVRQVSQVIDPYKRDLGDPKNQGRYALNSVLNSTPFRMTLNPKLDAEGNEVLQNQGRGTASKILENMIMPWSMTEPQYSDLVQEAMDIKGESSDSTSKAFPGVPKRSDVKKWLGDDYDEDTYYNIKSEVGDLNRQVGNRIIEEDWFKNLSADDKATALSNAYAAINAVVREDNVLPYQSDNKLAEAYREGGIPGMVEKMKMDWTFKNADMSKSDWKESVYNDGNFDKLQEAENIANEYGIDSISESEWKDYDKFGEKYFRDEMKEKGTLKEYDLPANDVTRTLLDKYGEKELPYIKQASDDITSIVKGTNKWGEDTYQGFTEKLYDIWKDYGKSGAESYANMLQYDGNGDKKYGSLADKIPYLEKSSLSDAEKSYLLEKSLSSLSDKALAFKEANPETGVYDYYRIKEAADGMGTNSKGQPYAKGGDLAQGELIAYLNSQNMSREEKISWFMKFFPDAKKIPQFN